MGLTVVNFIRNPDVGGKFVVLLPRAGGDDGMLVLSDFHRDFQHVDIVARWEVTHHATLAAAGLRVAGGGWWKYEGGGLLVLYGQSAAYGRFDPAWLRPRVAPGMIGHEEKIYVR